MQDLSEGLANALKFTKIGERIDGVAKYNSLHSLRFPGEESSWLPIFGAVDGICTCMKLRVSIVGFVLAVLALMAPHQASAQDGLRGAFSQLDQAHKGLAVLSGELLPADFDHDSRLDGAVLSKAGWLNGRRVFRIDLHLTAAKDVSFSFRSAEPELELSAVDVNRDGALDIVVEKPFTHQRVEVFLNDGYGAFQKVESYSYSLPKDSALHWRHRVDPLYMPMAMLASSRGFELPIGRTSLTLQADDLNASHFWPTAQFVKCAARDSSGSRAPPSLLHS